MNKSDECVKVVVRVRPLSNDEERNGNKMAVETFPDSGTIIVSQPKSTDQPKTFTFDAVFGPRVVQKHIYNTCAANVVDSVLQGYNGTIFAYGQTGSGKTHTMEGHFDDPSDWGIIPNAFHHIFDHIANSGDRQQFLVRASYLEIYNEGIRDLLSKEPKNNLELKEHSESGVYVKDLTSYVVKNASEIDHVLQRGKKNRSVGATLMNATSSRSHAIFTVVVESTDGGKIRVGKLNLVDLAGSERQTKTGATGDRLKEATKINLSLTALGNVISSLVDGSSTHIPYRDSKLTRLLQNSLGGNAKTVMCANCGPADYNFDETLSTLRYANRAKNIKNTPKINEDPKDAMMREYQDEIRRLKEQLEATQRGEFIMDSDRGSHDGNFESGLYSSRERVKEVIREVRVDLTAEQLAEINQKTYEEKQQLMQRAQDDMQQLIDQNSRAAQERAQLRAAYEREVHAKRSIEDQKQMLLDKLRDMEEKLLHGGDVASKMSQQEVRLRAAQQDALDRQQEKLRMARDLAEKEEAALQLEEHFTSLQDEVDAKSRKLRKLLAKYQASVQEVKDLTTVFQLEKDDMVETIRQLTRSLKLKDLIIVNFIPDEYLRIIEQRAVWNECDDAWQLRHLEVTGKNLGRLCRPVSHPKLRRPETNFTRMKRQTDPSNMRYKNENLLTPTLEIPESTVQEFEGPDMISRVDDILRMDLFGDDEDGADWVEYGQQQIGAEPILPSPYKRYGSAPEEKDSEIRDERSTRKGRDKKELRRTLESTQSSIGIEDAEYDNNSTMKSTMKSTLNRTGTLSESGFSEIRNTPQIQVSRHKSDSADYLSSQRNYSYSNAVRK